MSSDRIEDWLDRYERAWASNSPDDVRSLFTDDATYRTEPYADPAIGVDEIVELWTEHADEPESWTFERGATARDGDRFFVEAVTRYPEHGTYSNLWIVRLSPDGRANEFTEWYMHQPESLD